MIKNEKEQSEALKVIAISSLFPLLEAQQFSSLRNGSNGFN